MFCLVCGEQRYLGFHWASGLACLVRGGVRIRLGLGFG